VAAPARHTGAVKVTWGDDPRDEPQRPPVEMSVLDALARGVDTVPALAQVLGVPAPEVTAAVTWAEHEGLATRMPLTQGEHLALTERGLTAVAVQRRLASLVGPDGEIDLATLGRQVGETWQAVQEGRAAELARSQAQLLADDADRDAVVARLNEQCAQGAISLDELERRSTLALTGHTRGDLAAATAGLEVPGTPGAGTLQTMVRTFLLVAGGLLALGIVMITLLVLLVRS
jgi:Domain of unknown function (DUF1707)